MDLLAPDLLVLAGPTTFSISAVRLDQDASTRNNCCQTESKERAKLNERGKTKVKQSMKQEAKNRDTDI